MRELAELLKEHSSLVIQHVKIVKTPQKKTVQRVHALEVFIKGTGGVKPERGAESLNAGAEAWNAAMKLIKEKKLPLTASLMKKQAMGRQHS